MNIEALLNSLHAEIMNIPAKCDDLWTKEFLIYKEGHRDARHAAVELVMEFARKLDSGVP